MGNQGHSSEGARLINEWIQAGVIGPVHEVHVWTNRPLGYWPQPVPRPQAPSLIMQAGSTSFGTSWNQGRVNRTLAEGMGAGAYPIPEGLHWDIYLGPVAEDIPYHPIYHPFNWRGWTDFGMGALGDMGAHLIDHPFWALGLDVSDEHRSDVDAVGHDDDSRRSERARGIAGVAQPAAARVVSGRDERALSVRGPRVDAAGEAVLVGRRPLPAAPRRAAGRRHAHLGRRRDLRRREREF